MTFNPGAFNWEALAGLASGNSVQEQMGNVNQILAAQRPGLQAAAQQNKTLAYLRTKYPDLAAQVEAGMPVTAAWSQIAQAQQPKQGQFVTLPDGTYGSWDGQNLNKLGVAQKPADLPAIADEYNWMKTQGYKGTPEQYQAYKAGLNKSGFMVEQSPDGFRVVQGDLASAPSKITEGQSKDINWLTRGNNSNEELSRLDAKLAELGNDTAARLGMPGNYLKDADYQLAERAGRDFLAVVLRKDSGGAITAAEMAEYGPMFLPQPGDKPPAIAAKKKAREVFLKAMTAGLPKNMQGIVPNIDQATPSVNTTTTSDPVAVTLPDGTQGTIRRTK
jgi:hypothetical protein